MPSQPDYAAAHRLSPKLIPLNPQSQLAEAEMVIGYLSDEVAKLSGKTREQVMTEARKATNAETKTPSAPSLPQTDEGEAVRDESEPSVSRSNAKFYADSERSTYHPIDELPEGDADSNILYFLTAMDAEEEGFVSANPAPEKKAKKGKK